MITPQQLVPPALAIGRLLGLLEHLNGNDTVNTAWFSNPVASLEAAGTRLDQVVDLLYQLLGEPVKEPPVVSDDLAGAQWLLIPNPKPGADGTSPFYVVVPARGEESGQIGLGIQLTTKQSKASFTAYVYVPLLRFGRTGTNVLLGQAKLLGQANHPLRLGVTMAVGERITVGPVSFNGIDLQAALHLDGTSSTAALKFLSLKGTMQADQYETLGAITAEVQEWLEAAVLQATSWLNQAIGETPVTPGMLLAAAGFLKKKVTGAAPQYELSLEKLQQVMPQQIALDFLWGALTKLVEADKPLLKLPGGELKAVVSSPAAPAVPAYGLNLRLALPLAEESLKKRAGAAVSLVVGNWLGTDKPTDNWMTRSGCPAPTPTQGLTVWLIEGDVPSTPPRIAPGFSLVSAGLDIAGVGDKPLVDLKGYTLRGAELRTTLHAPTPRAWQYGFGAKLDRLGLPLLPALGTGGGAGANPVAQSLLQASAPPAKAGAQAGDDAPVNPAFGVATGWYSAGTFNVQLFDKDGAADEVMLPINRALGPLFCRRLGIGWEGNDKLLALLFDGAVQAGPLTVDLDGLTVQIPVTDPTNVGAYDLDLLGLGVDFAAGQVSLNAALVKVLPTPAQPYTHYDGMANIQAGKLGISALGSYAWLPSSPTSQAGYASLFVFGALLQPLGGPSFFFVTGLAAGFGYNRKLLLPAQDQVPDFPLLQVLSDPKALGGKKGANGAWTFPEPTKVLNKLRNVVPPERGQYWLAAGVRFTSFDLVHTSALLSVAFGSELKIGVTGISWMSLPPPPKAGSGAPDKRFAYVEMGIAVEVLPEKGVLTATAILTANSFVIDPDCRLSGGFAFYTWFGNNPHAGEFVLTVGGYHPAFTPPAHYPKVPRLGFRWPVSDTVTISGDAYFALTPSAIMAGAGLQILFSRGNLNAWFIAQMDALVQWAPFQYDLNIAVSIGVSYRLDLLFVTVTLKVELGASLVIWGPRMGGQAHISWSIISFTVGFGADRPTTSPRLRWTDAEGRGFAQTLLPHQGTPAVARRSRRRSVLGPAVAGAHRAAGQADASMLTIGQLGGISSTYQKPDGTTGWVVRPATFRFSALTAFPLTEVRTTFEDATTTWRAQELCPDGEAYFVSVRPMRTSIQDSVLTVTLTYHGTAEGTAYDLPAGFELRPSIEPTQAAKWGKPLPAGARPEPNATLPGRLMGFESITPRTTTLVPDGEQALHLNVAEVFKAEVLNKPPDYTDKHLPLTKAAQPAGLLPQARDAAWDIIQQSLQDPAVEAARAAVYDTLLHQFGLQAGTNGAVLAFGRQPGAWLNGLPLILPTT